MERHGKDAIAVDGLGTMPGFAPDPPKEGFDIIPMWVADMNFPTVKPVPAPVLFCNLYLASDPASAGI